MAPSQSALDALLAQQAAQAAPEVPPQAAPSALDSFLQMAQQPPTPSDITKTESFLRGASQGATFNLGDELSGLWETYFGTIEGLVRGKNAFGDTSRVEALGNILNNYRRARDTVRQQNEEARLANPSAFLGGEISGMAFTTPAMSAGVGLLAKGAQATTKAVQVARGAKATTDAMKITNAVAKTGQFGTEAADKALTLKKVYEGAKAASKVAAAEGAVLGYGGSEAELTPDQMTLESAGQAALDVGVSTGISAGLGGVLNVATRVGARGLSKIAETEVMQSAKQTIVNTLDSVRDRVAETAGLMALRAIKPVGGGIREVRRMLGLDKISQFGEDLLNESVTPLKGQPLKQAVGFKTLRKTKEIIEENLKTVSDEIDGFVQKFDEAHKTVLQKGMTPEAADKMFKIDPNEFASKARSLVRERFSASAMKDFREEMLRAITDFQDQYAGRKLSLTEAIAERQGFQKRVNYYKSLSAAKPGQQALDVEKGFNDFQKLMNDTIDNKVDNVLERIAPEKRGSYKKLRQLQGNFLDADRITNDALAQRANNSMVSLTDMLFTLGGATIGSQSGDPLTGTPSGGVGALLLIKGLKKTGPRVLAKGANTIVKGLKAASKADLGKFYPAIKAAEKSGVPAVMATHLLLYSTDDEYKKQIQEMDDVE